MLRFFCFGYFIDSFTNIIKIFVLIYLMLCFSFVLGVYCSFPFYLRISVYWGWIFWGGVVSYLLNFRLLLYLFELSFRFSYCFFPFVSVRLLLVFFLVGVGFDGILSAYFCSAVLRWDCKLHSWAHTFLPTRSSKVAPRWLVGGWLYIEPNFSKFDRSLTQSIATLQV